MQYLPLCGRPILQCPLERLGSYGPLRGIFAGVSPDDPYWPTLPPLPKVLGTFAGGQERAHTVLNGLKTLLPHVAPQDWVMVHDAVRPCVRHRDIDKLSSIDDMSTSIRRKSVMNPLYFHRPPERIWRQQPRLADQYGDRKWHQSPHMFAGFSSCAYPAGRECWGVRNPAIVSVAASP